MSNSIHEQYQQTNYHNQVRGRGHSHRSGSRGRSNSKGHRGRGGGSGRSQAKTLSHSNETSDDFKRHPLPASLPPKPPSSFPDLTQASSSSHQPHPNPNTSNFDLGYPQQPNRQAANPLVTSICSALQTALPGAYHAPQPLQPPRYNSAYGHPGFGQGPLGSGGDGFQQTCHSPHVSGFPPPSPHHQSTQFGVPFQTFQGRQYPFSNQQIPPHVFQASPMPSTAHQPTFSYPTMASYPYINGYPLNQPMQHTPQFPTYPPMSYPLAQPLMSCPSNSQAPWPPPHSIAPRLTPEGYTISETAVFDCPSNAEPHHKKARINNQNRGER